MTDPIFLGTNNWGVRRDPPMWKEIPGQSGRKVRLPPSSGWLEECLSCY